MLVRLEVDKSRRVQCQCRGCGKTVYADIHIIQWPDGEIVCWGSRCFEREMGIAGKPLQAVYSRVNGRKLTDEERDLLDANRQALTARIKGIEEEIIQAEKRREQAQNLVDNSKVAKPINVPEITRERVREPVQQQHITSPSPPQIKSSYPIRYDERAHKFTVIFRNQAGEILEQLYRGDEQFCRSLIQQKFETYPLGTKAEIKVTKTGQVLYQQRKG